MSRDKNSVKLRKTPWLLFILFFFGLAAAQAQDVFNHPLNQQTENAFREICLRLSQHQFIRGNFEQEKKIGRNNRSLNSTGNFLIAARQGMVWNTARPFPSTLTLGRDFLIQSRPGGKRTVLNAQGNETFLRMADVISNVFTGNAQGLMDNFEVFYLGSPDFWELGLTPSDRYVNFFAERIIIKGDTVVKSIQIFEQNGDSIKYVLSNHSFPTELNNNEQALFSIN